MKNSLILSTILSIIGFTSVFCQVGINTEIPKATLDVVASPADMTRVDGMIAPRLTGNELKAKDALYLQTTGQTGAIVYVTAPLALVDTTPKTINVTSVGYYYFDGIVWKNFAGAEQNIYNSNGTLLANRLVNMDNRTLNFSNGSNSILFDNNGTQSFLSVTGSSRGAIRAQGGSAIFDMFVDNANAAQLAVSGNATSFNLSTQSAAPINFYTANTLRATLSSTGNFGINTPSAPTHKLHVVPSAGTDPVKIEGLRPASGSENNVVVDLTTGVLKYSPTVAQPLFHAKLAANQTSLTGTRTILLGTPDATSSLYIYNTTTGVMTFNATGNYLVQMQMSFRNVAANEQVIIGIMDSGGNFIGRGSTRIATTITAAATVGQIHQYNTVISVTAGQQITFAANGANTYALLKDEVGTIGTGNVSNITVIKL